MRAHPFAKLIIVEDGRPNATHMPFALYTEDGSEFGILRGHVARPNPVWSEFDAAIEALVVFQGPHH